MSHQRHREPGQPPTYRMACDWPGCTTEHAPILTARSASDARAQARLDGWRAPNTSTRRHRTGGPIDLCPAHRGAAR